MEKKRKKKKKKKKKTRFPRVTHRLVFRLFDREYKTEEANALKQKQNSKSRNFFCVFIYTKQPQLNCRKVQKWFVFYASILISCSSKTSQCCGIASSTGAQGGAAEAGKEQLLSVLVVTKTAILRRSSQETQCRNGRHGRSCRHNEW